MQVDTIDVTALPAGEGCDIGGNVMKHQVTTATPFHVPLAPSRMIENTAATVAEGKVIIFAAVTAPVPAKIFDAEPTSSMTSAFIHFKCLLPSVPPPFSTRGHLSLQLCQLEQAQCELRQHHTASHCGAGREQSNKNNGHHLSTATADATDTNSVQAAAVSASASASAPLSLLPCSTDDWHQHYYNHRASEDHLSELACFNLEAPATTSSIFSSSSVTTTNKIIINNNHNNNHNNTHNNSSSSSTPAGSPLVTPLLTSFVDQIGYVQCTMTLSWLFEIVAGFFLLPLFPFLLSFLFYYFYLYHQPTTTRSVESTTTTTPPIHLFLWWSGGSVVQHAKEQWGATSAAACRAAVRWSSISSTHRLVRHGNVRQKILMMAAKKKANACMPSQPDANPKVQTIKGARCGAGAARALMVFCAAVAVLLQLDGAGAVPLTKALYAEIANGAKESKLVTSIPANEFYEFHSDITLGAMPLLESIGSYAFGIYNTHTKRHTYRLEFGDCPKLTKIGFNAFKGLGSSCVISFGATPLLESIGNGAFQYMLGTLTFEVGDCPQLTAIGSGAFRKLSDRSTDPRVTTTTTASTTTKTESVVAIGATPLLETIGDNAFGEMEGRLTVKLGNCNKLTTIGASAFLRIKAVSLASMIVIGATPVLESIGENAFLQTHAVVTVEFGDLNQLTTIGRAAFYSLFNAASSVTIGATPLLESVGLAAFEGHRHRVTLELGDCNKLITIGERAFARKHSEFELRIGATPMLESIGNRAFQDGSNVTLKLGDCYKLTTIDERAFQAMKDKAVVTIGATPMLESIGKYAFDNFGGVLTIDLGDCKKLTTLGLNAFYRVASPASTIRIGATPMLESIGLNAFYLNQAVVTLELGDCTNLTTIEQSAFGMLSNTASSIAIGATPLLERVRVYAFNAIKGLVTLEFGDCNKLIAIEKGAFSALTINSAVTIGATPVLESVGESAFDSARGLCMLQLGDCNSLKMIGYQAFTRWTNVKSVIAIGATPLLESVGEHAFANTKGTVTINGGECPRLKSIGSKSFHNMPNPITYIGFEDLKGLQGIGQASFKDFKGCLNLGGFTSTLTHVDAAAFEGTTNTESILRIASKGSAPELEHAIALASSTFGGTVKYGEIVGCGSFDADVPLTKAAYEAMQLLSDEDKASKEKEITCIPAFEFINYGKDVILGALPKLTDIHDSAFRSFANTLTIGSMEVLAKISHKAFAGATGKITIDAGNCTKLLTIERFAFAEVGNADSTVALGAMPAIRSIGFNAFEGFKGILTIMAGEMKELSEIPPFAFAEVSNAASSVSVDTPSVTLIGESAFKAFAGTVTIGALPKVKMVASSAFKAFSGTLTIATGGDPAGVLLLLLLL